MQDAVEGQKCSDLRAWKPVSIAPYSLLYEVSDDGLVRRAKTGRVLRAGLDGRKYPVVVLCACNRPTSYKVHRLVALAFIDSESKLDVNHKNGVKGDNRAENLEFVTKRENNAHARRSGLWQPNYGATPNAKVSREMVARIRDLATSRKPPEISRLTGVSYHIVYRIVRGLTWSTV